MILITDPEFVANEHSIINALFEDGLQLLHLRKPDMDARQLGKFISQIDARFHSRIMIHSHYQLLDLFDIGGIHFNGKTKHLLPDFENVNCRKSMALHDLKELKSIPDIIDYVFLSPLFPSVSKIGYTNDCDFEEIKQELMKDRNFKVVALGGITLQNFNSVQDLGFDDFAVLGSVWELAKTGNSLETVMNVFRKFNNKNE